MMSSHSTLLVQLVILARLQEKWRASDVIITGLPSDDRVGSAAPSMPHASKIERYCATCSTKLLASPMNRCFAGVTALARRGFPVALSADDVVAILLTASINRNARRT